MADEFVAMTAFGPPGAPVNGYNRGDRVPAAVVENWGLQVGEDGQVMPLRTDAAPRPEDDDRDAWEAYAIGQGWSTGDARAASLEDLQAIEEPEPDEHGNPAPAEDLDDPTAAPVRPDDDALKADWVDYVVRSGGGVEWANAKGTTKADLQEWKAQPGQPSDFADPVAASATEQANG
jgi:hypothetical protein